MKVKAEGFNAVKRDTIYEFIAGLLWFGLVFAPVFIWLY